MERERKVLGERQMGILLWVLRGLFVCSAGILWIQRDIGTLLGAVVSLGATFVPAWAGKRGFVRFPNWFQLFFFFFIFASLGFGTALHWYDTVPLWDLLLHTVSGFVIGIVSSMMLWYMQPTGPDFCGNGPAFRAIMAFAIALACGVVWEFYEFSMDALFGTQMQRGSNGDTMSDMLIAAAGAGVWVMLMYESERKGRCRWAGRLIAEFRQINPERFTKE